MVLYSSCFSELETWVLKMLFFGLCFLFYFFELWVGNGFYYTFNFGYSHALLGLSIESSNTNHLERVKTEMVPCKIVCYGMSQLLDRLYDFIP